MNPIYYYIGFGLMFLALFIGSGLYTRRIHGQLDRAIETLDVAAIVSETLLRELCKARAEAKKYKRMAQGADRERLEVLRERDELREVLGQREALEG